MSSDLLIAGVDEAGRGPLVGSVVAAAVILNPDKPVAGLADSKKLTEKKREALSIEIKKSALAWSIASISAEEVDSINILQATMKAMKQAVETLTITPDHVQVDGNRCPDIALSVESIVKGDAKVQAISAASILAKVERDSQMSCLHNEYPQYGFDRHKGYGTKQHMEALQQHGACPQHRKSFAPVKKVL